MIDSVSPSNCRLGHYAYRGGPEMHASLKELRTARGTEGFRQDELERCGTLKTGERLDWVCAHLSVLGCRQEPGEMTKRIFGSSTTWTSGLRQVTGRTDSWCLQQWCRLVVDA
eukprot:2188828-Rhodomonas_salina.2